MTTTNQPRPEEQIAQLREEFAEKCRKIVAEHPHDQAARCLKQVDIRVEWDMHCQALRQEWGNEATNEQLALLYSSQRWLSTALVKVIQGNSEELEQVLTNQPQPIL